MAEVVDYERPDALQVRTSKLAFASMLISLVSCPLVSGFLFKWIEDEHWINSAITPWGMISLMVLAPLLAATALVRIRRSKERLAGTEFVYYAFTFWGLWIVLAIAAYFAFRNASFGPGD